MEEQLQSQQAQPTEEKSNKKNGVYAFFLGLLFGILVVGIFASIFVRNQMKALTSAAGVITEKKESGSVLDDQAIEKLQTLEAGIDQYYLNVDDIDREELQDSIYHGLIDGLGDPYSTYYSPEELESVLESTQGVYYGIGAYIGYNSEKDYCTVTKCMDNSPALEAGLQPNDIIVEVDGEDMYMVQTTEIVTYIKGPEHTTVELTIYREGQPEYLHFTVERRKIETPTVSYEMDDQKIAYIRIDEFDDVTSSQFAQFMSDAEADGMKGLVIDLRDNPGGNLNTVVEIAGEILPKGLVVYTEDREGNRKEYKSEGKHPIQVPLVVLVNGYSASASEILAGSIKDYGVGTILGTTTFGKGIVQKIFSMEDGSALKLTISHYYTPKGNDIHGVGIEPDEVLELDTDAYVNDGYDNQLERAKEIILKQID